MTERVDKVKPPRAVKVICPQCARTVMPQGLADHLRMRHGVLDLTQRMIQATHAQTIGGLDSWEAEKQELPHGR